MHSKYNLPLFLDGARLGYGMAAYDSTITMKDLAEYCDIFYIGGGDSEYLIGHSLVTGADVKVAIADASIALQNSSYGIKIDSSN